MEEQSTPGVPAPDGTRDSLLQDVRPAAPQRGDTGIDPLLGVRLGNYEISFVLGAGSYGSVYKARDVKLDRFVAIKFLHEFLDARHEAMFLREAKAIAALGKHANIVQIYEWNEHEGRNYFVLEFVGSNAGMLLRVHPRGLPVEQAVRVAGDCAEGLAYAHKQNIVHRDVKPANVLLEIEGGVAKLADFGVARIFDGATAGESAGPGGSPPYMAPEIVDGAGGDARSDVFSLGVTLYELLCGKLPFEAPTAEAIMERIRRGDWVPLTARTDKVDEPLNRIIARALAHRPEDRFSSAGEFAAALRGLQKPAAAASVGTDDAGSPEDADVARARAYKAAQDARQAGAEKLANAALTQGTKCFRDGEAYEHLRQFAAAARCYEEAAKHFAEAENRANVSMERILALKAAQRDMEAAREEAKRCGARELVPAALAEAEQEDAAARATQALGEATGRYRQAASLYRHAAERAKKHGEALLVEPRRAVLAMREKALHLELEAYAPDEIAEAEAAMAEAEAHRDNVKQARALYTTARTRFQEAARVGLERKQREADLTGRPPITVGGIPLVWIPPGTFTMGSSNGSPDEKPPHEVTMPEGFWIGRTPVTQAVWTSVMGHNPSGFRTDDQLPVENVSWRDCQAFLEKFNEANGGGFRLCSEAEWEYACRAGSTGKWCFGDDVSQLDDYAWHPGNAGGRTHAVGVKRPNAWGLHDMHGNVCEWCADDYTAGYDIHGDRRKPGKSAKVTRGGSWCVVAPDCRSACRAWSSAPDERHDFVGLRVCRDR